MNRLFSLMFFFLFAFSSFLRSEQQYKQILVSGGAGFLGSHMCDRLIKEGHKVYCLDNLQTGSMQRIEHLLTHARFSFLEADVAEKIELDIPFDEIYNFACPASPPHYQKDPIKTTKTSVLGALNLLELAKKTGAKIFQASTSEIYGDALIHPQKENYWGNVNPIGIRSCYDEGKRCAESLFFDYHRIHNVKIKVARIFNTYGPGMDLEDGRVISNFIIQALNNSPITIYGNGNQTRSFCYVDDLIDAILIFMKTPDNVTGPLNLGNPDEYTVSDIAAKILNLTSSRSVLINKPLPLDDPKKRRPDITLAALMLNWRPKVSIEDGLQNTIEYFQTVLEKTKTRD